MNNSVLASVVPTRFVFYLFLMLWAAPGMPSIALGQNGRIEQGEIFSNALTNNLLGDSGTRPFSVYLPSNYDSAQKRYPVVYALHAYGVSHSDMVATVQPSLDSMMATRTIGEMIVVFVNATNRLWGSQYLSSPVIGDYETYITKDLVAYIDAHYRTLATRNSRGITGVSMGGWGSMHLALKFPEIFSVAVPNEGYYDAVGEVVDSVWRQMDPDHPTNLDQFDKLGFPQNWAQSLLAGLLPDLQRPELYTDYPYELINGQLAAVDTAQQRLRDGDVSHGDLGRYVKKPVLLNAIKVVHGTADSIVPIIEARAFTNALTAAGVQFTYEEHSGGHVYVPELCLPFLSANLQGAEPDIASPRLALTLAANGLQLVFPTQTNVHYIVESCATLDTSVANWLERSRVTGDGQSATLQYPCPGQAQFFRVKATNAP
jgi:enterochelin esterase-like enzyme